MQGSALFSIHDLIYDCGLVVVWEQNVLLLKPRNFEEFSSFNLAKDHLQEVSMVRHKELTKKRKHDHASSSRDLEDDTMHEMEESEDNILGTRTLKLNANQFAKNWNSTLYKALESDPDLPPVYTVEPLLAPQKEHAGEEEIINWLSEQPPSSVVFLCFGSQGRFEAPQIYQIATALERSTANISDSTPHRRPTFGNGKSTFAPRNAAASSPSSAPSATKSKTTFKAC
nr:UDP-glycosyltransferase 71K1-like [Ipomoea batatas]